MPRSTSLTVRLTPETAAWVEREAGRTHRSREAVVEALAEEAARARRFPGLAFRGPDGDRRAWLLGTALDVWETIGALRDAGSLEALLAVADLPEPQVPLAMRHAEQDPAEIERALAANARLADEARLLYSAVTPTR
jgi:hypothetical protein